MKSMACRVIVQMAWLAIFCLLPLCALGETTPLLDTVTVFYDIANSSRYDGPIAPQYVGNSLSDISATNLQPNGPNISSQTSGIPTVGAYVFRDWADSRFSQPTGFNQPNMEFKVTPNTSFTLPRSLKYTFWSANYSDIWFGPNHIDVWVSKDNFSTGAIVASHPLARSYPGNLINDFVDDLSSVGAIEPGQTLSVRFIAYGPYQLSHYESAMGGFWNNSSHYNVVLEMDKMVTGVCGGANNGTFTVAPSADLCANGNASGVTGAGPWTWTCQGVYGGTNADCSANIQTYSITFTTGGNGTIGGDAAQTVNHGASTSPVTAIPVAGYHFVNWIGTNGFISTTSNPLTIDNVTGSQAITANFIEDSVTVSYDIANSSRYNGPIAPQYAGNSLSDISATSLQPNGVNISSQTSGIPSVGAYVFRDWADSRFSQPTGFNQPNMEFKVTPNTSFTLPRSLKYTFWSSNYSDIWFGPNHIDVWVSKDNFSTGAIVASHPLARSYPGNLINDFVDDLSSVGAIEPGQTLSVRFIAYGPYQLSHYESAMGGFWNNSSHYNVVLEMDRLSSDLVTGVCGGANNGTFTVAPSADLCANGNASGVTGAGPWSWTCQGVYGGTKADCSANIRTYRITPFAGTGGSVSPDTRQTVNHGSVVTFTVSPDEANSIATVSGCGGSLIGGTFTTTAITGDCDLVVTFIGNGKNLPLIQLPQTGLSGCWDAGGQIIACSGTGQDAAETLGAPLPATRFTDNDDGTLTDNLTGLVWLKNGDCFGQLSWPDAINGVNSLASGACGLSDGSVAGAWQMPNRKELLSLINWQAPIKWEWLTSHGFADIQDGNYWTSSTFAADNAKAFYVNFGSGGASSGDKSGLNNVLGVRHGE